MLYCEVILPLSVKGTFTYSIPKELESFVQVGSRVEVQFGRRKLYTALVKSLHNKKPLAYQAKEIIDIVDQFPIVYRTQLAFWQWMANYYCCFEGEVMSVALPAFFRQDSETLYVKNPDSTIDIIELPDNEYLVASALERQASITLSDIQIILQGKTVQKTIKSLIEKQVLLLQEFLEEKYKPKLVSFVRLHPQYAQDKATIPLLFKKLEKKPKQTDMLLAYLNISSDAEWISRSQLLKSSNISGSVLRTMMNNEIFQLEDREVSRVEDENIIASQSTLNEVQQIAFHQIKNYWKDLNVVLLRGVTASGKTHIYVELIRDVLAEGKQILYLVPEITLTTQLVKRLEKMLGKIGVYHSRFNPAERVETWLKVVQQEYNVIVGARSSIFLPFSNLGLIIIDEEHDASYKQSDPAPRYQARDSAIWLAHHTGAKVLLGSATPSVESWANAKSGKFGLVELENRFGEMSLPQLYFINMSKARKEKHVTGMVSDELQIQLNKVLSQNKQAIIFQNRRGYSPYISCRDCSWIPYCQHCDVALTFHKYSQHLKCHYCGYTMMIPKECPSCQSTIIEMKGAGTERIEDDLQALFPSSRTLRLDYDTAKTKYAHEKIIEQFEQDEADILIGTQMVTKGLDFKNVQLVGVLNADSLLYYPDFRALERAYQLLSQVSGRSGRSEEKGKVVIQISDPNHPIVGYISNQNIENFYKKELGERMKFRYPPFVRLIQISVKDTVERVAQEAAEFFSYQIKNKIEGEVLGPTIPTLSRIQGKYIREILIKIERNVELVANAKSSIGEVRQLLYQYDRFKKTKIVIDVDP
ncbi:MAG: primosomal protein N' [Chitinophagales bacterium]|nr:primosomal protein N' [Chitinophagales bacterium]